MPISDPEISGSRNCYAMRLTATPPGHCHGAGSKTASLSCSLKRVSVTSTSVCLVVDLGHISFDQKL